MTGTTSEDHRRRYTKAVLVIVVASILGTLVGAFGVFVYAERTDKAEKGETAAVVEKEEAVAEKEETKRQARDIVNGLLEACSVDNPDRTPQGKRLCTLALESSDEISSDPEFILGERGLSCVQEFGIDACRGPRGPASTVPGPSCVDELGVARCIGERGLRGLPGNDGADSTVPGATGPVGPGCVEALGLEACQGPRGEKGDKGERGNDGAEGPRGADGATGPPGPAGPTCPSGTQLQQATLLTADGAPVEAFVCVAPDEQPPDPETPPGDGGLGSRSRA